MNVLQKAGIVLLVSTLLTFMVFVGLVGILRIISSTL